MRRVISNFSKTNGGSEVNRFFSNFLYLINKMRNSVLDLDIADNSDIMLNC